MNDAAKQYEAFAKELKRRFEEAYRDSKPPLKATLISMGGENVEITIQAIDRRFVEMPVLVSFTAPNAVEVAWDVMEGAADRALDEARRG
jgi:hypothetical protein